MKSFQTLTALALTSVLFVAACGGDGGDPGGPPDPRKIPTATAFAVLPEPTILAGGLLVTEGGGGDTYVVKAGDTLVAIAADLGVPIEDLISLNDLADPSRLEVDQVLRIPPRGGAEPAPVPDEESAAEPTAVPDEEPIVEETPVAPIGADEYEVQSGDNASDIAARFGVTLQELADANDTTIDELRTLFVGRVLKIPQFPDRTPVPTSTPAPESEPTEVPVEVPTELPLEEPTEGPVEEPLQETPAPLKPTPVVEVPGVVETAIPQ